MVLVFWGGGYVFWCSRCGCKYFVGALKAPASTFSLVLGECPVASVLLSLRAREG